jgi:hypothetical protein
MNTPAPSTPAVPTQAQFPWRTVARTVFQTLLALAVALPLVIYSSGISTTIPAIAGALAVAAGVTRIMALPEVNWFLQKFVPWLAADTKS